MSGRIYGVGLGPGAADLMSVRADRLVRGAGQIAHFRKAGRMGRARRIVEGMLREGVVEFAMDYPVTTEIPLDDPAYAATLAGFYADCATRLRQMRGAGDVVVLCEGDPFFYGSFMHLYTRLRDLDPVVVPGITGMSAAWTASGEPITWGDDALSVVMATLPEAELTRRIADCDALVVMKIGGNAAKLKRALVAAGRMERAVLIEYAAMPEERVMPFAEAPEKLPYFSIVVIHGQGRRP